MLAGDAFKMGIIINIIWLLVTICLNTYWYKYCLRLNDEWADILETLYREIEDYYTKGEENNEQSS